MIESVLAHIPDAAATRPAAVTEQVCSWLSGLRMDHVPDDVIARTKLLLLDGIVCALVGAQMPWSRSAVDIICKLEGTGNSPLIGWDRQTTPSAATTLNSTFIQGFELDDFHPFAPIHGASIVIPALLAASHQIGNVSGEAFLLGAVAGFELGPRVGLALHGAQMLSRGWHSGPVFGTFAAAASVGILLDLDATQFDDALGMAATQSSGLSGARFGAMCKRMQHGYASRNGLQAAFLAAGGFTGIRQVFDLPHGGFLSVFGEGHSPDAGLIVEKLGERWEIRSIITKQYSVMGGIHAPLDALFAIAARRQLSLEGIESVDVFLPRASYAHGGWTAVKPLTPVSAQMNVSYCLAAAILDRSVMVPQFSPSRIASDDIWKLIPKIRTHHDPNMDASGPKGQGQARVSIRFSDGTTESESISAPRAFTQPLTEERALSKLHQLTDGLLPEDIKKEIVESVLRLETLPTISTLHRLLSKVVGSAFPATDQPFTRGSIE